MKSFVSFEEKKIIFPYANLTLSCKTLHLYAFSERSTSVFAHWRDLLAGETEKYKEWLRPQIRSLLKVREYPIHFVNVISNLGPAHHGKLLYTTKRGQLLLPVRAGEKIVFNQSCFLLFSSLTIYRWPS